MRKYAKFICTSKDKLFLGLVYDGKDCDENELEFEPGMGFSGPDIY